MTKSTGQRRLRFGTPICTFPECGRKHRRLGLCDAHSQQLRKRGFLLPIGLKPRSPKQAKEDSCNSYGATHGRLRRWLGPASNYLCVVCGIQAKDWAYDKSDPNPLTWITRHGKVALYSADLSRYESLCRGCHTKRDRYAS